MLVIGGTGTVGTEVVRALTDRGAKVRVMTRTLGAHSGAEYVAGSLESPETLGSAFDRVSKVYLLTPLAENEVELGMNAVKAAQESGVNHIVFQSVHHAADAPQVPHFKTKLDIIEGLRSSGIPYTVLSPNNFFQNDLGLQEAISRYGVYAAPIGGVGCSRVDVRDIGDAAAVTLLEEGHEGRDYALVGPEILTGEECAAIWARYLGRHVAYGGNDLEAWAEAVSSMMPEWLVRDLCIMFAYFQEHGLMASEEEVAELTRLLGRPPRSFEDFVAEVAPGWC
jgi:uncharacterized protein YbjT (DUF2867 family)